MVSVLLYPIFVHTLYPISQKCAHSNGQCFLILNPVFVHLYFIYPTFVHMVCGEFISHFRAHTFTLSHFCAPPLHNIPLLCTTTSWYPTNVRTTFFFPYSTIHELFLSPDSHILPMIPNTQRPALSLLLYHWPPHFPLVSLCCSGIWVHNETSSGLIAQ